MKTTTLNTKCYVAARSSAQRAAPRAHTPQRRVTGPGAARLTGSEPFHSYVEDGQPAARQERQPDTGMLRPRVLHVDADPAAATALADLLTPEAQVIYAPTLADARQLLATEIFSLLVVDPALPDGDVRTLLPMLSGTPLLIYSAHQPEWRGIQTEFLPKPWTTARQLWIAISTRLGISDGLSAGA